jgi:HEAT repeat protein
VTAPSSSSLPDVSNTEPVEPPFSPTLVVELVRLLGKAARATQLYLPNNPIYQGAIGALRAGFVALWNEADELTLVLTEQELRWYGVAVSDPAQSGSKSSDNLAWLFYKDGIRELNLTKGFEEEEVIKFLAVIQRARKANAEEDDLVAMLWEADFTFLQYKYVDLLAEGGEGGDLADGGAAGPPPDPAAVRESTQAAVEESRASNIVTVSDFDATLYFLDDREIEYLHDEIRREYAIDLRTTIVATLLDIFETQQDPEIRGEVVEDLHKLMVYLLTAGQFRGVAYLLREARAALQRNAGLTADQRRRLEALPEQLSAPEALSQLLQALDSPVALPPQEELISLFDQLQSAALSTVFSWLGKSQNSRLRELLEAAAGRLAAANSGELVRLIQSPDGDVAAEAIRRAGALRAQAAVLPLGRILVDGDVVRRQLAVQALMDIGSPGALQQIERGVEDEDREVRITAVKALSSKNYRPALSRIEAAVKGKAIRDADLREKMAFFEGYGALCGDAGIPHLDAILNGKGFLGRREDAETRACAAMALGRVRSPRAVEALKKALEEKDVVVRSAVNKAMRPPSVP